MLTWKRYALTFALGATLPIVAALYAGGERIAVLGFRIAAIENGVQLATRDWHVDGVPAHEEMVAQAEPVPAKKAKARR